MRSSLAVVCLSMTLTFSAFAQDVKKTPIENSAGDRSWMAGQAGAREWSREEMMKALPADMPEVTDGDAARWEREPSSEAYDTSSGPGFIPGGTPAIGAKGPWRAGADEEEAVAPVPDPVLAIRRNDSRFEAATNARPTDVRSLGYTYPAPYSRYETFPNYTGYPHKTVGKVFFSNPLNGKSYVCSASSIGGDAVITAAHCVRDGKTGTWWTNWTFVPAYRSGVAPYGQWTANHLWSRTPYVNGAAGDSRYDVGGAVLNRRSLTRISDSVGFLGFMWNASSTDTGAHWALIGYPAASPFHGQYQYICQSSFAYNGSTGAPATIGAGCDMTGGCSGGPWLRMYAKVAGNWNYVNGVNSYRRCFDSACTSLYTHELFTPYFDANIKVLRDCLVNSIPGNPVDPAQNCAPGT